MGSLPVESGEPEKWIKHYSNRHKILLLGEGDFSFAACLATTFGSAPNIIATSLDSEVELGWKHPTAAANLANLKERGCTIIHEVNACIMMVHPCLRNKLFDRIVFNFPHAGFKLGECNIHQISRHQEVVRSFLWNAELMLTDNGEVHVTHKTAYPFSEWKIKKLGEEVGLRLLEEPSFYLWDYPGYVNKRSGTSADRSNESFPVGQASTFKFVKH